MAARLLSFLSLLALVIVTTAATLHASRMPAGADHAEHARISAQATDHGSPACDGETRCSARSGLCEFVCAGMPAFLPGGTDTSVVPRMSGRLVPEAAHHAGWLPGLNERPPRHRLL